MIIKFMINSEKVDIITILFDNTNSTECCNKSTYYLTSNYLILNFTR